MTMNAVCRLACIPERIRGLAAGSTTEKIRCTRSNRYTRATIVSVGSMARTPSIVAISVGKSAASVIERMRVSLPNPISDTKIGTSATGGMARKCADGVDEPGERAHQAEQCARSHAEHRRQGERDDEDCQ